MKTNVFLWVTTLVLFATLAIPVSAQQPHYKLIDIGTFGGQASYVSGDGNGTSRVLNNGGTLTGSADMSTPDPFPAFCFNEDCLVSHTFKWRDGVMTNLGALKNGVSSASNGISANGLIAGVSENGKVDPLISGFPELRAVLWRNGQIINLGTLPEGGHESVANAVNSRSQVVGAALNKISDPNSMVGLGYQTRAFVWDNGTMRDLGTLGTGTDAQAVFLNEKGQAVGWSYIDAMTPSPACNFPLVTHSFVWDREHGMVDLGGFGGTCTIASAINNRGQIVGESNGVGDQSAPAFIWENGSFKPLGGSLGGDFSGAAAISDEGEAVGFAYLTNDPVNGPYHAVLWKHIGELTDLGTLGGDPCSFAPSINAKAQVVGISISDCTLQNPTFRPFLWMDGSLYDLNALIPPGSSLYLQSVETINDRGEIAGSGVDANGDEHAFLLIPCSANGGSDCQEETVGAEGATENPQRPLTQPPQLNLHNSIRQMLRRRILPVLRDLAPTASAGTAAVDTKVDTNNDPSWQQNDMITKNERASSFTQHHGYCLVSNGKLTGSCIASYPWFCLSGASSACPSGASALKPQKGRCGLFGSPTVDVARPCSF